MKFREIVPRMALPRYFNLTGNTGSDGDRSAVSGYCRTPDYPVIFTPENLIPIPGSPVIAPGIRILGGGLVP